MNLETSDIIMIIKIVWRLRKGQLKENNIMQEWWVSAQLQLHWQVPFRSELRISISKSIFCRITTQTECKKVELKSIKDSWIDI